MGNPYLHSPIRRAREDAWTVVAVTGTLFAAVVVAAITYGTNSSSIRYLKEPLSAATHSSPSSTTGQGGSTSTDGAR
jgi:hypothetical protein